MADNPNCVWNKEWRDWESIDFHTSGVVPLEGEDHSDQIQRSEIFKMLVHHLKRLVQERDEYAQVSDDYFEVEGLISDSAVL